MISLSFKPRRLVRFALTARGLKCLAALAAAALVSTQVMGFSRDVAPETEPMRLRIPSASSARVAKLKTTGYCACQECCGWRYSWFGLGPPVTGMLPFWSRPKEVGRTSSGSWARPGTIAADTRIFPYGTIMHVPGYGYGRVEDTGSAITGYHIDLYFKEHGVAQRWGVRTKDVRFWKPAGAKKPRSADIDSTPYPEVS